MPGPVIVTITFLQLTFRYVGALYPEKELKAIENRASCHEAMEKIIFNLLYVAEFSTARS